MTEYFTLLGGFRLLDTVLTRMKRFFFSFYRRKNYLALNNIVQQHFGAKNTLSRGYPTKLKNYGNSRGNYTLSSFRRHSHMVLPLRIKT